MSLTEFFKEPETIMTPNELGTTIKKVLDIKAKTDWISGSKVDQSERQVFLIIGDKSAGQSRNDETGKMEHSVTTQWVLVIDGTPGHWYLTTLLGNDWVHNYSGVWSANRLSIQGSEWWVTNMHELLREAIKHI